MRLIEAYAIAPSQIKECEDTVGWNDSVVVLADGVTSKTGDIGSGRKASRALVDTAMKLPETTVTSAELESVFRASVVETKGGVVCALYHAPSRKVWRIGDVTVGINGTWYAPDINSGDENAIELRVSEVERLLAEGVSSDIIREQALGRKVILPMLKNNQRFANVRYAVVNGTPVPARFIEAFEVDEGAEIVFASDGYRRPFWTLAETEAAHALDVRTDPLCVGVLSGTKPVKLDATGFDDRSYVRFIA